MTNKLILCLVRDLLFYSKIRAGATEAGVAIQSLRDPTTLIGAEGQGLIVDLNQEGALAAAAAWREKSDHRVIGFVSHVDTETIAAARAAGIDRVVTRGQFDANLAALLKSFTV